VVATEAGEQCLVVDPGKDAAAGVADTVREHRLQPVAVLLTHGHLDHVWSVVPVCGSYGVAAYLHPADDYLLSEPLAGVSGQTSAMVESMTGGRLPVMEPDEVRPLADAATLELAGIELRVDHAPGHTPGSVMFRRAGAADVPPLLLSGDVLFAGSIGRTDLPGGDHQAMLHSLRDKVLPLADDTVVLPGHGATTTIAAERAGNPYLGALAGPAPGRGL
jgi:glyoxylase-like metal-dependent hydrolase (beta-lactamase superfamily II)